MTKNIFSFAIVLLLTQMSLYAQPGKNIFPDSGYVGIGTISPTAVLQIETGVNADGFGVIVRGNEPDIVLDQTRTSWATLLFRRSGANKVLLGMNKNNDLYFSRYTGGWDDSTLVMERLTGNIGLGTSSPSQKLHVVGNVSATGKLYIGNVDTTKTTGYSLAVNGPVLFTKAVVKNYNTWPDYVFEPEYDLRPIYSLEAFLKVNKHLPEVPSSQEIQDKGLSLADNTALLMKKIEELTLYIIQQQKEIDELKKRK